MDNSCVNKSNVSELLENLEEIFCMHNIIRHLKSFKFSISTATNSIILSNVDPYLFNSYHHFSYESLATRNEFFAVYFALPV